MTPTQTKPAATPHSPLPWKKAQGSYGEQCVWIDDANGSGVLNGHQPQRAKGNSALIVASVNSAPALRESLAECVHLMARLLTASEMLECTVKAAGDDPLPKLNASARLCLAKARSLTT